MRANGEIKRSIVVVKRRVVVIKRRVVVVKRKVVMIRKEFMRKLRSQESSRIKGGRKLELSLSIH